MGDFLKFTMACARRAFTRSVPMTELVLFIGGVISGLTLYFGYKISPQIEGGILLAFVFVGIVCARFIAAPYFLWREQKAEIEALKATKVDGRAVALENWVRSQSTFPVGHAACLLAGQDLVTGAPTGAAAGFLTTINREMVAGNIHPIGNDIDKAQYSFIKLGVASADQELSTLLRLSVSRADLAKLATQSNATIPGLTACKLAGME